MYPMTSQHGYALVSPADLSEEKDSSKNEEDKDIKEILDSDDEGILQDVEEIEDDGPIEEGLTDEEHAPPNPPSSLPRLHYHHISLMAWELLKDEPENDLIPRLMSQTNQLSDRVRSLESYVRDSGSTSLGRRVERLQEEKKGDVEAIQNLYHRIGVEHTETAPPRKSPRVHPPPNPQGNRRSALEVTQALVETLNHGGAPSATNANPPFQMDPTLTQTLFVQEIAIALATYEAARNDNIGNNRNVSRSRGRFAPCPRIWVIYSLTMLLQSNLAGERSQFATENKTASEHTFVHLFSTKHINLRITVGWWLPKETSINPPSPPPRLGGILIPITRRGSL
ncbi:unnamed protein product [Lactuca saligna]|uniref:Uncharacterized protein n=1 Tax=Lactuca saligna TaxID=75948 RepID=A0AA35Z3G9_LACSI|nr:unnamed protein product [Lactuca saligna]